MNKVKCAWMCIILTVIMFFANCGNTYSVSVDELKQQQSELQGKLNTAKKELEQVSSQMSEAEKQVVQLNAQITIYQNEISTLQNSISENEAKLKQAEEDYAKRNKILANRIIAQYEAGDITYLDFLLGSEGIVEFISNYYLVSEIAEMDVDLLNQIENTKREIEETKKQLEQDKAEVEAQMSIVQAKKEEREAYINQLNDQEKSLQAERDKYNEELEKVKKDIIANSSSGGYIGGGKMLWPLPGYKLGSDAGNRFGYRWHPVYHDWRLHTGIDIAAPKGAAFLAAESGTVIVAQSYYGGYGNAVVIDHGGGITTLYGHGTSILVSKGQYVTKGTPVLTVGSTGVSTGNHAHFEVRKNGTAVDPLPYLEEVYL